MTRIFTLYLTGISQQQVADGLNRKGIHYSAESPMWSRQRITQTLRNPHYAGKDGYPVITDGDTFRMANIFGNTMNIFTSSAISLRMLSCFSKGGVVSLHVTPQMPLLSLPLFKFLVLLFASLFIDGTIW